MAKPTIEKMIHNQTINETSYTSRALEIFDIKGYFSIQGQITGAGASAEDFDIDYLISNDGINFMTPEGDASPNIIEAYNDSSGPGSDGKFVKQFQPQIGGWIKIRATNAHASAGVMNLWLMVM